MSPKALTSSPALSGLVFRNHWREVFDGTTPEGWEPTLSVSVVIASYNSATLPFTLASLAAQDYPEHLLDVVVVDDGSEPPVELGEFVPKNLQVIRVADGEGWGRSNATDIGIKATTGDIIYWVDADMVLFSDNVRQHAKWAHFIPEAATIGNKGFVEEWDFTPERVYNAVRDGSIADYYDRETLHRHWSLDIFDKTDDLNESDGRNYSTHMGACASVTRTVYDRTHGQDTRLHLGEDTEIAYQLWQAGAVFIPVNEALTWHLGRATVQDRSVQVAHINDVYFAERMPIPRGRRKARNRQWEVPLLRVVVEFDLETAHLARPCVDRILQSVETDMTVDLVGPWGLLHEGRRKIFADPLMELYLVHEWYRADGRVNLVETAPESVFPSPFRIDVPVTAGLSPDAIRQIYRRIDGDRLGLVRYFTPGRTGKDVVTAWNTAAIERAKSYVSDSVTLEEAIDASWGVEWTGLHADVLFDLRLLDLDAPIPSADPVVSALRAQIKTLKAENGRLRKSAGRAPQRHRSRAERAARRVARRGINFAKRCRAALGRRLRRPSSSQSTTR